jgi:hypothetical protein
VKYGCLYSRGKYVLFLDADGATHYSEIESIMKAIKPVKSAKSCVIGNRYADESDANRKGLRKFFSVCMGMLVRTILGFEIKDT